ncbi:MAG: DUF11 domain-containing protein [Candidatus Thorarchaeota archaeon]|nr:MAG: DUF11 domain-containing protein [Candidatus Thorarchaeota archaeon]
MKIRITHAFVIVMMAILIASPAAAAFDSIQVEPDQVDDIGQFFTELLDTGAELLLTNIDSEGAPAVIYGQLGLPSEDLGLSDEMFDGNMAFALIATQGELLEYALNLIGGQFLNASSKLTDGQITAQQFEGGLPDPSQILQMIGTDFGLLFSAYLNLDAATANSRMSQVLGRLDSLFGLSFTELFTLRIDESIIPPDVDVQLPFDSLDIYVYNIVNEFADTLTAIMDGLDTSGILGSMDSTKFTDNRGSAAGLLAIPDMGIFNDLFGGGEEEPPTPLSDFAVAQFPMLDGPLAIAAVGYIDDQVLTIDDTSLSLAELIGATGSITPMSEHSYVVSNMPVEVNITGYSPSVANLSYHEPGSSLVFWNASGLGVQSDYEIFFDDHEFPPEVSIERTFAPGTATVGGSIVVTVTVTNNGGVSITDVEVSDVEFQLLYSSASVTGTTSTTVSTLLPGESESMQYTVTFANEGAYLFPGAKVNYTYDATTYDKDTVDHGFTVEPEPTAFAGQLLSDAMANFPEITLGIGALFGLTAIYSIAGIVRGGGGRQDTYGI